MKKKLLSVLGIITFASLSLSLRTSLHKTHDTALKSTTKTSLATVFGSNTNLGIFQATPTLETILSRAKSLITNFHNENIG
jgi:hypothetical protein